MTAPVIFYCRLSNKLDKDVCTGKNISRGQKIYMTSSMKNISNLVVEVGGVWSIGETQEVCTHLTIERNHPWAASSPQQSRHGRDTEIRAVISSKVASASYIVTAVNADTVRLIPCLSPAVRAWLQHRQFATICNLSVTTCCSFLLWFGQRRGHRTGGDTLGRRWATRGCCIHYELW